MKTSFDSNNFGMEGVDFTIFLNKSIVGVKHMADKVINGRYNHRKKTTGYTLHFSIQSKKI